MSQQQQFSPQQQASTLKIIWIGMMVAPLVYLAIGMLRAGSLESVERSVIANMVWLFGVAFIGMGFALPKMLYKEPLNAAQYTQSMIIRWAMFESVAVLALVNFISQGVPFLEMAVGVGVSFVLVLISKPKAFSA